MGSALIIDGEVVSSSEGKYPDMDDYRVGDDDYDYDKHYEALSENLAKCEQAVLAFLPKSHEQYGRQLGKTKV